MYGNSVKVVFGRKSGQFGIRVHKAICFQSVNILFVFNDVFIKAKIREAVQFKLLKAAVTIWSK